MGILTGIRVLEFADGWSGAAIAGKLLAELGATVIKVEPLEGDSLRRRPPLKNGESLAFPLLSCGKASVALDYLGSTEDAAKVLEIACTCDVILDGLPFALLRSRGLGVDAVRAVNPNVIWSDVSCFGRNGPLASEPACDLAAQAISGFMTTTGFADTFPTPAGFPLAEHAGAAFAVTGVLAALLHRDHTGQGQDIDIAAVDCLAYFLSSFLPAVFVGGAVPSRQGFRHPLMAPWDVYDARDGKVIICSGNDPHWHSILRLVGRPDLIGFERYASPARRVEHVDEVNALIQAWIGTVSAEDAIAALHEVGIPAGPILDLGQVFAHPHFRSRGELREVAASDGSWMTSGSVYRMNRTPGHVESGAPALGTGNCSYLSVQPGVRGPPA